MFVLREVSGHRRYPLAKASMILGRAVTCDIQLNEPRVSGRHARLDRVGCDWFITDVGSSNGTFINGQRIRDRTRLAPGDRIDFSGIVLEFVDVPAAAFTLKDAAPGCDDIPVLKSLDVGSTVRTQISPEAKLRALLEVSRNLSGTLDLSLLLPKILESLFVVFPQTDRGFVLLREMPDGPLVPKASRQREPHDGQQLSLSRTVIDHVLRSNRAVLSADAGLDGRFDQSQSIVANQIRSIMCVPMQDQDGEILGVIQLDTIGTKNQFRQEDLDVLVSASLQAARVVELAQLHETRRDLEAATEIQKSFLPAEQPHLPGLTFFDYYASALHVGGDYYDYVQLPGDRLAIALGDVAGKGVAAALLMARLSAAVRFCLASEPVVAAAVRQINAAMTRACGEGRFVTFLVCVIDLRSCEMSWVNAGHISPLLRQPDGTVSTIGDEDADIPLGVFDRPYAETKLTLTPGQVILLCTDGVIEARNNAKELYGLERLTGVIEKHAGVRTIGAAVLDDIRQFTSGRPPHDDVTVVCFGRDT